MRGDVLRKQSQITKHSTTSHLSFVQFSNMADAAPAAGPTRGGFGGRGRGGDRGGRGRGRGRRGPRKDEEKEWVPVTKLGRLVRAGKIKSMEVSRQPNLLKDVNLMTGNLFTFTPDQRISD